MGVKKLRSIFMKYILIVAIGMLCIIFFNVSLYMVAVKTNVIYTAVDVEKLVEEVQESLQVNAEFSSTEFPCIIDYARFDVNGTLLQSSLDEDEVKLIWENCVVNKRQSETPYRLLLIERENDVIILRYRFTAQFNNSLLSKLFPVADMFMIVVTLVEVVLLLFWVSYTFGKYTGTKIEKMLFVTQKIKEQNLDFTIDKSGIFEIDQALNALDDMRLALKQSLNEQWQVNKVQQEQISSLAHDLKTPLTIIRGNADLLHDTPLSDEQNEYVNFIEKNALHMQTYIQTLIEATKSNKGFILSLQSIKTSDFLSEIRNQAKALCSTKSISLEYFEDYKTSYINIDSTQMLRVFENILSNAAEHSPKNTSISLTITELDKSLKVIVRDMGKGFSSEALLHATDQFYMEDKSRNSKNHHGMGLYIAKAIVNQHGGNLFLSNDTTTGGATVTIQIPIK